MVGLFSYNTPKIFEAVKEAGKLGKVRIVGFDEEDDTLRGVQDGSIYAHRRAEPLPLRLRKRPHPRRAGEGRQERDSRRTSSSTCPRRP